MSNYSNGRQVEYATRDVLQEYGYRVIRAAGSKGETKADLVAVGPANLLFVQCKLNDDKPLSPPERKGLFETAGWVNGTAIVSFWHKEGRSARTIRFVRLTGIGPREYIEWKPMHVFPVRLRALDI